MAKPNVGFDDVEEDDVVLIDEETPYWRNCLMIVEVVRSSGVAGTVFVPPEEEHPLEVTFDGIAAVYRKVGITTGG